MKRMIAIELRRSNALTLVLLLIAASLAGLLLSGNDWTATWIRFSYLHGTSLFLLLPLALAGGAVLGRREKRTHADELIASTGRPKAQRLLPGLLAVGLAAGLTHLVVFAVAGLMPAMTGSYVGLTALLWPLTGTLALIGGVWLGLAAGRAWASPLVPPLVAVLALVAQIGLSEVGGPGGTSALRNLSLFSQPPSYDWETITPRTLIGWTLLGLGLAGGGYLLATGRSWLPRVAAVAVMAVAFAGAAVVPGTKQTDHYRIDAGAQKLVCADGAPQVCVTAVHAYVLDDAAPQVRKAMKLLAKLPGAPTKAAEWRADEVYGFEDANWMNGGTTRPEPGTLNFDLVLDDNKISEQLVENIVVGAGTYWNGCQQGWDVVAGHAAGAWLMGTDELTGVDDGSDRYPDMQQQMKEVLAALRAAPEKEQIRRVAAMRDAALSCGDTDQVAILTGKASA
ncbi:hypothetical protein Aab01nite_76710 [Paractinoplanes abujensis]|uniref:Uncharacterized protein n=1 Tax=Paractinoplanes abujensis TaxID=882441 RepID=A0A7W7G382_9ACTN|nr:hypothetical protein [Actinoplanes abujensis]MBB4692441.1 hypothetical protein [Actinoplanes abujensis]GID24081.1 hypothetical protein Aab01nite_76710 [Actinoplanes abujensis]